MGTVQPKLYYRNKHAQESDEGDGTNAKNKSNKKATLYDVPTEVGGIHDVLTYIFLQMRERPVLRSVAETIT